MPEGSTGEKADNFTNLHIELLILPLFACGRFEPPWAEKQSSRYDRDFRYFLCLFFLFFVHYFRRFVYKYGGSRCVNLSLKLYEVRGDKWARLIVLLESQKLQRY